MITRSLSRKSAFFCLLADSKLWHHERGIFRRRQANVNQTSRASRGLHSVRFSSFLAERNQTIEIRKNNANARSRQFGTAPLNQYEAPTVYIHTSISPNSAPIPYRLGHAWQCAFLKQRLDALREQKKGTEEEKIDIYRSPTRDRLLFFEHDPVYTLGRGADENNLVFINETSSSMSLLEREKIRERLSRKIHGSQSARLSCNGLGSGSKFEVEETEHEILLRNYIPCELAPSPVRAPNGASIYRIERGGEVTYHGPGQLVVYPLLDLRQEPPFRKDLHWYLRQIEEVVIRTLASYGIDGRRDEANTGVWVKGKKICAVGVSSSRWITTHGFALNVNPDLSYFDTSAIIPCGLVGKDVTSLSSELLKQSSASPPSMLDLANRVVLSFETVFNVKTRWDKSLLVTN